MPCPAALEICLGPPRAEPDRFVEVLDGTVVLPFYEPSVAAAHVGSCVLRIHNEPRIKWLTEAPQDGSVSDKDHGWCEPNSFIEVFDCSIVFLLAQPHPTPQVISGAVDGICDGDLRRGKD